MTSTQGCLERGSYVLWVQYVQMQG